MGIMIAAASELNVPITATKFVFATYSLALRSVTSGSHLPNAAEASS